MATPYAYFKREIVPLSDAKIGVMTHAFNYGTAVFEGVRGNWNEDEGQIYVFRMREHYDRLRRSCRIMRIDFPYENEELSSITTQLVEMSGYREDVYIRPLAYKSSELLGVRLHDRDDAGARGTRPPDRRARHRPHRTLHLGRVLHDGHGRARHAGRRAGPPHHRRRPHGPGYRAVGLDVFRHHHRTQRQIRPLVHAVLLKGQGLTIERPARTTGTLVGAGASSIALILALALVLRASGWPVSV